MDGKQLDSIARGLAREMPRRGLLGGLLGGTLALLSTGSGLAARRRDKRRRRSEVGAAETGVEEVPIPPGALVGGIWDETMEMCHFDPETGEYSRVLVNTPLVPQYLNMGDTLYIDCCVFADCSALPCYTPTSCIEGACAYDPVAGDSCALQDGTIGVCDAEGMCVAGYAPPPASSTTYTPAPASASDTGSAPVQTGEGTWVQ